MNGLYPIVISISVDKVFLVGMSLTVVDKAKDPCSDTSVAVPGRNQRLFLSLFDHFYLVYVSVVLL